ncbi:hypothetical protein DH96_02115 [Candidatus Phytoplasma oryzae]|uniref:Uncharacterized protein n=1 Tax=Candidatus Phytoplasma oryzae TaxID=203274 RepID=A0A328IR46_9MOLU|nr:hypothetical protein [Candidatus Phytoplasma oryzae]RAM57716.1 hypothetical protein DH96_02115 [Candidatus Phytoplasma oryzae]
MQTSAHQTLKTRITDYFQQRNYAQERLEQEKMALNLQLQSQQLELWTLKNKQLIEEQTKKEQADIIKTQQAQITQLEEELKEKKEEIIRLDQELNNQMDAWVQKGQTIKALEAKIEGMEAANEKNTQKNQLLENEINKLKEDLRKEKKEHQKTKTNLQVQIDELVKKNKKYANKKEELKTKTEKWSGIGSTISQKVDDDFSYIVNKTKKAWNTFKSWFS